MPKTLDELLEAAIDEPTAHAIITNQRAEIDRLHDALRGLVDWCSEGCPDGGVYSLIEARAALAGLSIVTPNG